jgi:hypothetical protein
MGRVKTCANFLAWNGRFTFLLVFTILNYKKDLPFCLVRICFFCFFFMGHWLTVWLVNLSTCRSMTISRSINNCSRTVCDRCQ